MEEEREEEREKGREGSRERPGIQLSSRVHVASTLTAEQIMQ